MKIILRILFVFCFSASQLFAQQSDTAEINKTSNDSLHRNINDSIVSLNNVTVKSKKILVEPGKTTYLVGSFDTKTSLSATDLLVNTPTLSVTPDKQVKIKNKIDAIVLLNGSPVPDLRVLDGILSKNIQRIEVITNPGAAHDIEGIRGIVNIVTRKTGPGYFADVTGQLSTRSRADHSADAYISRKGKLVEYNLNAGFNYYRRPFESSSAWTNLLTANSFSQHTNAINKGINYYIFPGINIYIDSLTRLSFKGSYGPPSDYRSVIHSEYYSQTVNGSDSLNVIRNNTDAWLRPSMSNSVTFRKRMAVSKDIVSISFRQYTYRTTKIYTGSLDYPANTADYTQQNGIRFNEIAGQIDYQLSRLFNAVINAGVKYTSRYNHSVFVYNRYDTAQGKFVSDTSFNTGNSFSGRQNITAFYFTISKKCLRGISAEIGNRVEYTTDHISFAGTSKLDRYYASLLPAVAVVKTFGNAHSIEFNLSRRILRPGSNYLNPFMDNGRDPREINQGNPLLKPEKVNRYDIGYTFIHKNVYSSISAYMVSRKDVIGVVTSVYSRDTLLKKYNNINRSGDIGFSLNSSLSVKASTRFTYGGGVEWNSIASPGYKQKGFSYYSALSASVVFSRGFSASMSWRLSSTLITFQGTDPKRTNTSFSLSKTFIKKIAFSVSMTDFLPDNSIWVYRIDDRYIHQYTKNNLHLEAYKLRVSYSFGETKNRTNSTIKINSNDLKE